MLTNTDPFAAWFVVTGDATPDGIRVVRSVLGAIRSLPIVASREEQSCVAKRTPENVRNGGSPGSPGCHEESEARMVKGNVLTLSAFPRRSR